MAVAAVTVAGGCVEQELHIDTNPDGALVFMNDQEVGRTPIRRPFTYYGTYDVVIRKEGYQTLRTKAPVIAPAWLWVPMDLIATVLPIRFNDTQKLSFELKPDDETAVDPDQMVRRGRELQTQLESGLRTVEKKPATKPAKTAPATKRSGPASGPTTEPGATRPAAGTGPATLPSVSQPSTRGTADQG